MTCAYLGSAMIYKAIIYLGLKDTSTYLHRSMFYELKVLVSYIMQKSMASKALHSCHYSSHYENIEIQFKVGLAKFCEIYGTSFGSV